MAGHIGRDASRGRGEVETAEHESAEEVRLDPRQEAVRDS